MATTIKKIEYTVKKLKRVSITNVFELLGNLIRCPVKLLGDFFLLSII